MLFLLYFAILFFIIQVKKLSRLALHCIANHWCYSGVGGHMSDVQGEPGPGGLMSDVQRGGGSHVCPGRRAGREIPCLNTPVDRQNDSHTRLKTLLSQNSVGG